MLTALLGRDFPEMALMQSGISLSVLYRTPIGDRGGVR